MSANANHFFSPPPLSLLQCVGMLVFLVFVICIVVATGSSARLLSSEILHWYMVGDGTWNIYRCLTLTPELQACH